MIQIVEVIPLSDAAINSAMPYENYGNYHSLFLGKYMNHSIYRTLLQFQMPALLKNFQIKTAEIIFHIIRNDYPAVKKKFEMYRVTENFNEETLNYANQPSIEPACFQTFTINDEINTTIKIDITELFLGWRNNKYPNQGILIKATDEHINSLVAFYSKDCEKFLFLPKLQISFETESQVNTTEDIIWDDGSSLTAEEYYSKGNKLFQNSDYKKAYEYYKKSFKDFSPNTRYSPKLLFKLVQTLDKLCYYDEELDTIDYGLNCYNNFTDLEYLKAKLYYKQEKTYLAIKGYIKCLQMGDSPIHLNFISGAGSYKAYYDLSEIYFELGDYDEAYTYCIKGLSANPNFKDPLTIMSKILIKKGRDLNDVSSNIEGFLGTILDGKDYMILADLFFKTNKYYSAYDYLVKAERFFQNNSKILYSMGMCQLFLRDYERAYSCFEKIQDGEFHEESIYKMILCNILIGNMKEASRLLNFNRDPESNKMRIVYYAFKNIVEGKKNFVVSDDANASNQFLDIISDLLETVLKAAQPETFEKSLQLLNLIENDKVLLRLGKIYYNNGLYQMAYDEFVRSIKLFNLIDVEGLNMMIKILTNSF